MLKPLQKLLHSLEDSMLIILTLGILGVGMTQIIMRNLQLGGINFADELLRNAVLWLAFLGAMRASRLNQSIAINLLAHYHNLSVKRAIHLIVYLSCAAVCGIAAYYCYHYVLIEYEGGDIAFLFVPLWVLQAVIPLSLGVIALRFIIQSIHLPAHHDAPHI